MVTYNFDFFVFFQDFLETHGFFIHLFLFSDLYFIFIIYQVVTAAFDDKQHKIVENDKVMTNFHLIEINFEIR
jgi:hypothetical protein